MRRCAFLTMDDLSEFVADDDLAVAPLEEIGWQVDFVPWRRRGVNWGRYDLVVIRTPWDYQNDPDAFLAVLEEIENSDTRLENPLELCRWNLRKTYLRDLADRGVAIVPTLWRDRLRPGELPGFFDELGAEEIVVKPVVSANADGAYRLDRDSARARAVEVEAYYAQRELMAQPFLNAVLTEGEYSLFYFNGGHSHTISKVPKAGDFRVQEEHGGDIRPVVADEELLAAGAKTMSAVGEPPLYARADYVRASDGGSYWLMELEVIEPALYLRMDAEAPRRFAEAIGQRKASGER